MTEQSRALPDRHILCSQCSRRTNHEVMREVVTHDADEDFASWDEYRIVRCRGCDHISFEHASRFSEDMDRDGSLIEKVEIFPNSHVGRQAMDAVEYFPGIVEQMYLEALTVFNAGALTLAAIGVRALVESICIDQECKVKNLAGKIDELVSLGVLSKSQADFLHLARFMGNAAAHEMEPPTKKEIAAALDIAEALLKTVYELPKLANVIRKVPRSGS